jgi:hypothetical protein
MKLWCEKTLSETFFTGAQKYLAKRKLDSVGFIKAHSGIANCPERVQQMKSELQLADTLAQISRANKAEQALKKAAARIAPQTVTEAESDENAVDDNNTSQVVV